MSRRSLKADDVEGFVRAFWDEVRDTERTYKVRVSLDLRLSEHRGEISFHAFAYGQDDNLVERLVASSERRWPSHRYVSLHALLYSLANTLNIGVQKDYRERTGEWYSSATDEAGEEA